MECEVEMRMKLKEKLLGGQRRAGAGSEGEERDEGCACAENWEWEWSRMGWTERGGEDGSLCYSAGTSASQGCSSVRSEQSVEEQAGLSAIAETVVACAGEGESNREST